MIDLLTDMNGNLALINNDLSLISGIDRVAQKVLINLRFFYGEWFLDTTYGVKYHEEILVKNPDMSTVDGLLKAAIMDDPDVVELINYQSTLDSANRLLTVSFTINTVYGLLTVENENLL